MKRTVISVLFFLAGFSALGREVGPRTFGTSQESAQRVGMWDFEPTRSTLTYDVVTGEASLLRHATTAGGGAFLAHPHLPSGALLLGVEFGVCDIDPDTGHDIDVIVFSTDNLGSNFRLLAAGGTTDTPGCDPVFVDLTSADFTVDNTASQIFLDIVLHGGTPSLAFAGATVFYRLQVSPAPAVASFNDVPLDHPFFQFIEALKSSGITGGCQVAPPLYCPDNFVTRGQMAVFLAKALGLQFP